MEMQKDTDEKYQPTRAAILVPGRKLESSLDGVCERG